jgi:UDP-galactopyranose mutase
MNILNSFSQTPASPIASDAPLICFSHLRWDFVLQRPQHLMQRFSKNRRVLYFEEFIPTDHHLAYLEIHPFEGTTVKAIRPRVPHWWNEDDREKALGQLLDELISIIGAKRPILWFYTPMMYAFARHVEAAAVVYDCMDELANFRFAPPHMRDQENALIARADAIFTGGISLYEAKKDRHDNIHVFPSSVDTHHFETGRTLSADPADQADIPHPRFGYYGVIDERLDLDLVRQTAAARPNYSFVFLGPVAKISPSELPQARNIHYLGRKEYGDLPAYLSGWDAALMPFALNEATRYISPTKTPEYLAAGRPVISTKIADVVRTYGDTPGVFLADGNEEFAFGCDAALALARSGGAWLEPVDALLADASWDATFKSMSLIVDQAITRASAPSPIRAKSYSSHSQAKPHEKYDYLIVGAGFAGSVLAERLAVDGLEVLICDKRPHIAGNAYDHRDEAGILVHKYGPHIFHTNSEDVFVYLSRFTAWHPYEHRVLAQVGNLRLPMPINRTTLNASMAALSPARRTRSSSLPGALNLATRLRPREMLSFRKSGRSYIAPSSKATPASNGGLIHPNSTDRSPPVCRPGRTRTTAIFSTLSRRCRLMVILGCSSGCWTMTTSPS